MNTLKQFRFDKDISFREGPQSPLDEVQKRSFTGLEYFPENPALRFELLLERYAKPETLILATSTGDEREYLRVGEIQFDVLGTMCSLDVLEDDYGFFIPFVDATAPAETYGGGRYLEPTEIRSDILYVDFNLAYNPYCAYNHKWSCPLPPASNRLSVRIEAGEKNFPTD